MILKHQAFLELYPHSGRIHFQYNAATFDHSRLCEVQCLRAFNCKMWCQFKESRKPVVNGGHKKQLIQAIDKGGQTDKFAGSMLVASPARVGNLAQNKASTEAGDFTVGKAIVSAHSPLSNVVLVRSNSWNEVHIPMPGPMIVGPSVAFNEPLCTSNRIGPLDVEPECGTLGAHHIVLLICKCHPHIGARVYMSPTTITTNCLPLEKAVLAIFYSSCTSPFESNGGETYWSYSSCSENPSRLKFT